jgi:hypothetical protein
MQTSVLTASPPERSRHSIRRGLLFLGLGVAAGVTVLGTAGPAEAIVYQFDNVTADFRSDIGFFIIFPFRFSGTATITGSFDYLGGTGPGSLGSVNLNFNVTSTVNGVTVSNAFSSGYYDAAAERLVFGLSSGQCPSGSTTCLDLELATGLTNIPFRTVGFDPGIENMGDYFNSANADGGGAGANRNLTSTGGFLRAVPAPITAALLLPMSALIGYRRRLKQRTTFA